MATREKNLEAFLAVYNTTLRATHALSDAEAAVRMATHHLATVRAELTLANANMEALAAALGINSAPLTYEQAVVVAGEIVEEAKAHARLQRELAAIKANVSLLPPKQ